MLDEIRLLSARGNGVTFCEIAARIGRHEKSVRERIFALERKGFIRRTPRKHRTIEIIEQPKLQPAKRLSPSISRAKADAIRAMKLDRDFISADVENRQSA